MTYTLLAAVSLLSVFITQAVISGIPVFVKTGEDLLLDVKENVIMRPGSDFSWKFNCNSQSKKAENIVKYSGGSPFKPSERAEFFVQNFSLLLKNVQKNDSGDYYAHYSFHQDTLLVNYEVTVQDPVSAVELTVDSETDSCNLSVTCRTQDSHINITVRCENAICIKEGGGSPNVTTSGASLYVYLQNDDIICNYSNQVSWSKASKKSFCHQKGDSEPGSNNTIIVVLISIFFLILATIFMAVHLRRRKNNRRQCNIENTIYAVAHGGAIGSLPHSNRTAIVSPNSTYCYVERNNDMMRAANSHSDNVPHNPYVQEDVNTQHVDPSPSHDSSGVSPNSTYCKVGQHQGVTEPSDDRGNIQPESIYSQIQKPTKQ